MKVNCDFSSPPGPLARLGLAPASSKERSWKNQRGRPGAKLGLCLWKTCGERSKNLESVEEFRARRAARLDSAENALRPRGTHAKARTEANLTKRVQQLSERKLELDTQLRDLITSITKAERELESSFRKLSPNDAAKKEKLESDKDLLERLRRLKDQVAEDTRHKSAALEIDNTCKRVNAAKAGEAKLKKEMPPVRSRSCVNFRSNGDKDRPGSSPASPGACSPGGSRQG
ncbi:unnamed protein product [Effrenium voratum]|nr:unnamed protein product [Effrenium voratum]